MINIGFKKLHPDAVTPTKAYPTDTGFDIVAIDDGNENVQHGYIEYRTGIAVELPKGYGLSIRPRSSIRKYSLLLCNSPGTVDETYRGEILVNFKPLDSNVGFTPYKKGDKIAQLVVEKIEEASFVEVSNLGESDRGSKGFGSSGQ